MSLQKWSRPVRDSKTSWSLEETPNLCASPLFMKQMRSVFTEPMRWFLHLENEWWEEYRRTKKRDPTISVEVVPLSNGHDQTRDLPTYPINLDIPSKKMLTPKNIPKNHQPSRCIWMSMHPTSSYTGLPDPPGCRQGKLIEPSRKEAWNFITWTHGVTSGFPSNLMPYLNQPVRSFFGGFSCRFMGATSVLPTSKHHFSGPKASLNFRRFWAAQSPDHLL